MRYNRVCVTIAYEYNFATRSGCSPKLVMQSCVLQIEEAALLGYLVVFTVVMDPKAAGSPRRSRPPRRTPSQTNVRAVSREFSSS